MRDVIRRPRLVNTTAVIMEPRVFHVSFLLLPPANEVWGKVIFSEACVKNSGPGGGGCQAPGSAWSGGVTGPRGVSRPTTKGEIEGDLVQAHNQGGS